MPRPGAPSLIQRDVPLDPTHVFAAGRAPHRAALSIRRGTRHRAQLANSEVAATDDRGETANHVVACGLPGPRGSFGGRVPGDVPTESGSPLLPLRGLSAADFHGHDVAEHSRAGPGYGDQQHRADAWLGNV